MNIDCSGTRLGYNEYISIGRIAPVHGDHPRELRSWGGTGLNPNQPTGVLVTFFFENNVRKMIAVNLFGNLVLCEQV